MRTLYGISCGIKGSCSPKQNPRVPARMSNEIGRDPERLQGALVRLPEDPAKALSSFIHTWVWYMQLGSVRYGGLTEIR